RRCRLPRAEECAVSAAWSATDSVDRSSSGGRATSLQAKTSACSFFLTEMERARERMNVTTGVKRHTTALLDREIVSGKGIDVLCRLSHNGVKREYSKRCFSQSNERDSQLNRTRGFAHLGKHFTASRASTSTAKRFSIAAGPVPSRDL